MKSLPSSRLSLTDPIYLKRLCRELNALPDGFYTQYGVRCSRIRFSLSRRFLEIVPCGNRGFRAIPSDSTFSDAYGRTVTASRAV